MNNKLLSFLLGGIIGAGSATILVKNYYQKLAQNDISEIKEHYRKKEEEFEDICKSNNDVADLHKEQNSNVKHENKDISSENDSEPDYNEIINKLNYNEYSAKTEKISKRRSSKIPDPYLITPEQFADELNWDKVTLTYYDGDDTFANDEMENIIEGEELVGLKNMDSFGKFEDGILYVRNEKFGADYEIIFDPSSYSDAVSEGDW